MDLRDGGHINHNRRNGMVLTGELIEKVEKAEGKEEVKKILEEVGVELSDTELDQIAGGEPLFRLPLCQG